MSLFPSATLGSLSFRLLLVRPDLSRGRTIQIATSADTLLGAGRTTIEERRPGRETLLHTQKVTLVALGNALDDFRQGLAALGPGLVGMPLWVDALPVARWAERIYDPQQVINFDPVSGAFALYAAGSLPASPAYPLYAPLLLGRWDQRPTARALTAKNAELEVTLKEASPYSCRISVNTQAGGWTAAPDWSSPPEETSAYALEQIALDGVGAREVGLDAVNAAPQWTQRGQFTFRHRLEIRQHLTWFLAMGGALHSWSPVPAWLRPGADTPGTPANYTARFTTDTLTLDYLSGAVARAQVGFTQEIDTGARAQSLAGEAYLYRLDYPPDPANPERFTNWDAPLTVTGDGTYLAAQVAHQEIVRSLKPQDVSAEVDMVFASGSLAADWLQGRLFDVLNLTIWKCDPADATGTRGAPLFQGQVTNILPNGNTLKLTAKLLGNLLASRVPSWLAGPRCNTWVFSPDCGLAEASYRGAGTVTPGHLSSDARTLTVPAPAGPDRSAYPANWFAGGILRTGAGRSFQQVTIVSSTVVDGTHPDLSLALNRPLWSDLIAGGGQAVQLVPGCGLQYDADCGTKYNNRDNFRGQPFKPRFLTQDTAGTFNPPKK